MLAFTRPYLFWIAAPIILVLGVAAGIGSAAAEQPAPPVLQVPPRMSGEAAVRPQSFIVPGQVVLIDVPSRTIIVERRDGKFVEIYLTNNTVIKVGGARVRPRDIQLGDKLVAVGRPHAKQGLDASLITIAPRPDKSAIPK